MLIAPRRSQNNISSEILAILYTDVPASKARISRRQKSKHCRIRARDDLYDAGSRQTCGKVQHGPQTLPPILMRFPCMRFCHLELKSYRDLDRPESRLLVFGNAF